MAKIKILICGNTVIASDKLGKNCGKGRIPGGLYHLTTSPLPCPQSGHLDQFQGQCPQQLSINLGVQL